MHPRLSTGYSQALGDCGSYLVGLVNAGYRLVGHDPSPHSGSGLSDRSRAIFGCGCRTSRRLLVCPARVSTSSRELPDGPHLASGRCLPGEPGRDPRTMLPGGRGPRRVAPVRGAGRSTLAWADADSPEVLSRLPRVSRTYRGGSVTSAALNEVPWHWGILREVTRRCWR